MRPVPPRLLTRVRGRLARVGGARQVVQRPPGGGGRLASLGQDHTAGHRSYVSNMPPEGVRWLYTKPFSAPPNYELARCLRSFAHIVESLGLGAGAQVLDVGCGPGWVSEWLARCGYHVTGVDVSDEMVAIARARVAAIDAGESGMATPPTAEFHALAVVDLPWSERFDAAILYDALHHFHDERTTLESIRRSLVPGGRIYVHEGIRPAPGSEGERELIDEMRRYGTLESPFDPEYLVEVLQSAGFTDVRRLLEIDELVEVSDPLGALERIRGRIRMPETNTFIAVNPIPGGAATPTLLARLVASAPPSAGPGGEITLTLRVANEGTAYWPAALGYPYPLGSVNLAPHLVGADGARAELARVTLPGSLSPGQSVEISIRLARNTLGDARTVTFDLVREGVAWFGDRGSPTLEITLPL